MTKLIEMSEREYFASVGKRPGMFVGRSSFHAPPEHEARAIEVLFQLLDEFLAERENREAAQTA